jgi:tellurite resistance protein TehA-like permease
MVPKETIVKKPKPKLKQKIDFPKKWYEYVGYVFGWLTVLGLLFWIVVGLGYLIYYKKGPFFNLHFHRRVYYIGLFVIAAIILGLLFLLVDLI